MIALDTNILIYARRVESPHHTEAQRLVRELAEGDNPWAIPWPCIYELVRVVTHPRIFDPPSPLGSVLDDLESLLQSPSLMLLGEGPGHPSLMRHAVESGDTLGNLVHDAHIAALALEHGVSELWTADADFARFSDLNSRNPFREPQVNDAGGRYDTRRRRRRAGPKKPLGAYSRTRRIGTPRIRHPSAASGTL